MRLADCNINAKGIIREIQENQLSEKLHEFGIVPGALFALVSAAPFNGPLFIQVDNNRIALRKEEAKMILVDEQ